MKKLFLVFAIIMAFATYVYAADVGKIESDNNGNNIQSGAPNGNLTVTLTPGSYTTTGKALWLYPISTTDYKVRWMPLATSTKASYKQVTIPAYSGFSWIRNKATPFANISGATGTLIQQ